MSNCLRLIFAPLAVLAASCKKSPEPEISIWHGRNQRVGHLGLAQDDFNLVGEVSNFRAVASLQYKVNDGPFRRIEFGRGPFGFRRLAAPGHFNADLLIADLRPGDNTVSVRVTDTDGRSKTQSVTLTRHEGDCPLPVQIRWQDVTDPQDVGQIVDGHWILDDKGLRTKHTGYDRVFLIGEKQWQDYEVTVPITIHRVDSETSPVSGGHGVGIILRFAGHVTGGHRNFPAAQPKWGYQPFGAIAWLRWANKHPQAPPQKQFYVGYSDDHIDHGAYPIELGRTYYFKARCQTLEGPPLPSSRSREVGLIEEKEYSVWQDGKSQRRQVTTEQPPGVTCYSFKIWPAGSNEPPHWDWQVTQISVHALRHGAVALVAHHVDATFGDVNIEPIQTPCHGK